MLLLLHCWEWVVYPSCLCILTSCSHLQPLLSDSFHHHFSQPVPNKITHHQLQWTHFFLVLLDFPVAYVWTYPSFFCLTLKCRCYRAPSFLILQSPGNLPHGFSHHLYIDVTHTLRSALTTFLSCLFSFPLNMSLWVPYGNLISHDHSWSHPHIALSSWIPSPWWMSKPIILLL